MGLRRIAWRASSALAIVIPAGLLAALEGPTLFAGASAPSFPVACSIGATVTFNPPLTKTGIVGTDPTAVETTTISGGTLSNCLSSDPAGPPSSGTVSTLTITTPATFLGKVNKVKQYAVGYCPGFASTATFKSLKNLSMTISWTGGAGGTSTFTVHTPGAAINFGGEVGFAFIGKQGAGSYSEKPMNQITAYLDPTDSTALASACAANQTVSTVTIDPASSTAIL